MLRASILAITAVMLAGCDDESETSAVEEGEVAVVEEEPVAEAEAGAEPAEAEQGETAAEAGAGPAAAEEGEESLAETTDAEDTVDQAAGAPEEAFPTASKSLYGLGGGQEAGAEEPTAGEAAAADEGTAGTEPAED